MDRHPPKSQEWRERAAYYRALAQQAGSEIGSKAFLEVADGWDDLANRVAQLEEREDAAAPSAPSARQYFTPARSD